MDLPVDYTKLDWRQRKEVREQYVSKQNGMCSHCGKTLSEKADRVKRINTDLFPENFFKYPIHLHHCHKTGMTQGAVHNYCNAYLWQYKGE